MRYRMVKSPWKRNWNRKAPINEGFSGGKPHSRDLRGWKEERKEEINNVSGHGETDSTQRQGGECVISSQSGGFAGGGVEKTPAGDYSINTIWFFSES
jgi:hypothetical protein